MLISQVKILIYSSKEPPKIDVLVELFFTIVPIFTFANISSFFFKYLMGAVVNNLSGLKYWKAFLFSFGLVMITTMCTSLLNAAIITYTHADPSVVDFFSSILSLITYVYCLEAPGPLLAALLKPDAPNNYYSVILERMRKSKAEKVKGKNCYIKFA